jgi:lipase
MSRLHLHAWGPVEGRPVLVVHGVTNTGARYRRLAEEELPGARVLAPDLRGHGRSTWEPPWSVSRHVDDLVGTLDAAGAARVAVVGHSFGGLIGMALAAAHPERVAALALVDPAVAIPPGRAGEEAERARRDEGWATADEARAARLALRPDHARDSVDEDLETFLEEGADGRVRFRFSRPAAVTAWSEMAAPAPSLAAFPGRVLLVEARRADFVTGALRARLRADLGPRLREEAIDAGHMLFWDAREELGRLVREAVSA